MSDVPDPEVTIFNAARRLPPSQRAAYLDEACAGDAALRHRLHGLLQISEEAGAFLANPAAVPPGPAGTNRLPVFHAEKLGDRVGRYKILQQIGEGGCGVVYMAEQEEPVRRRVALKVIKLGMDTKSVIARFEAERQALAMMDHPNIAKVLDAGATDKGRPYFVMELVRGIKITDYCDQNNLSTQARLDLFVLVCHAVQHAHQKGIIHRDIKPSNILVTMNDGVPMPKVIDFGIAKATHGKLTNHTLFTAFEQFIGTPAYMSPEQAEMSALDIDTRSDLYSLGVLLYELLTGKTPFDPTELMQAGIEGMRRHIREKEPARPSTRLSTMLAADLTTVAAHRQSAPPKLIHLVRGELDWIVMKCLEKDRTRRYDTANSLAADIQRHLTYQPVLAGPPGAGYKIQKFARRHRGAVLAGSFVLLALLAGIIGTTWGLVDALHQKREAERQGRIARHTTEFLTGMFASIDPQEAKLREITVREILDQASGNIAMAFPNDPMTELPIRRTMGDIYAKLGKPDVALTHAEAALRLAQAVGGEKDSPEKAETLSDVAKCLDDLGRYDEELPQREAALAMQQRIYHEDRSSVAQCLNNLATCLEQMGRFAEALPKEQAAVAMWRRVYHGDHPEVAQGLNNLAACLANLGRSGEALPKQEEAVAMCRRIYKGDHPDLALEINNLAACLERLGRYTEALPDHAEALAMQQRIYKGDHPSVARSLNNLASCLDVLGRLTDGLAKHKEALAMWQRIHRGDHPDLAQGLTSLAGCLLNLGRSSESLPKFQEALAMWQRIYKGDHPQIASCQNQMAENLRQLGRFDEALPRFEAALAMDQRLYPGDHPDTEVVLNDYALALDQAGRSAEALPKREAQLAMCQRIHQGDQGETSVSLSNFALCLEHLGRWSEALTNDEAALAMLQRIETWDDPNLARFHNRVGNCLNVLGRLDDALEQFQQALAMGQRIVTAQPGNANAGIVLTISHEKLGEVFAEMGKTQEAISNYKAGSQAAEVVLASDAANPEAKAWRLTCRIKLGLEKADVVVRKISPKSQAEQVGLREGDVMVHYAGKTVASAADLPLLTGRAKGSEMELEIRRDGAPLKLTVKAGPLGALCEDRSIAGQGI
jgi:eukaryotic-like serine/threonine-protein kinase